MLSIDVYVCEVTIMFIILRLSVHKVSEQTVPIPVKSPFFIVLGQIQISEQAIYNELSFEKQIKIKAAVHTRLCQLRDEVLL